MKIYGGCKTDIGIARSVNQDAIIFRTVEDKGQSFTVGAICDGVGSLDHGEIASSMLVSKIDEWYWDLLEWIDILTVDETELFSHLKDAVESWNQDIVNYIRTSGVRTGSTMSIIMIIRDRYYIIQVGDSRVYVYQNALRQLTKDASITKVANNGMKKNYLTNYVGMQEELNYTETVGIINENDLYIYGSDGFYHFFNEEHAKKMIKKSPRVTDWEKVCEKYIEEIKALGERDNISIGVIVVGKQNFFKR